MSTLITRLYATTQDAEAAAGALKARKLPAANIDLITASSGAGHDAIVAAGVIPSSAKIYAEKVQAGATLMVVTAPFGMAGRARAAIADIPAMESGVKYEDVHAGADPAPRSYSRPPSAELLNVTFLTGEKLPYAGQRWLPFEALFRFPSLTNMTLNSGLLTNKFFTSFMPMIIKKRES